MSNSTEKLPDVFDLRNGYPAKSAFEPFENPGVVLGQLYQRKHDKGDRVCSIPPRFQRQHICHLATTGEGKTTTAQLACLHNAQATNGVDLVVDPKGGFADELLPMWYHKTGSLEDVTVVDASTSLPRIPLFDLRPYLEHPEITISRQRLIEIIVLLTVPSASLRPPRLMLRASVMRLNQSSCCGRLCSRYFSRASIVSRLRIYIVN